MLFNFDIDGDALKAEHITFLRVEALPALRAGGSVSVIGLTDRRGSAAHNKTLSDRRVARTVEFLRREMPSGLNLKQTTGFGEERAALEGEIDGTLDERFRTVLLFLSPPPGPEPIPPGTKILWPPLRPPVVISQLNDNPSAQDLENRSGLRLSTELKALKKVDDVGRVGVCKAKLLDFIGIGGPNARELAEFFFANTAVKLERAMPAFWSRAVAKDRGFLENHIKLNFAIIDALKPIKAASSSAPPEVDINKLTRGPAQPLPLRSFRNDFNFGGFERRLRGDPLAFGIGGTQGHTVSIIKFRGDPDGFFEGTLRYELLDHFGSDDDDLDIPFDQGQPSLWLLQRKLVRDPSAPGCEPYRHRTIVDMRFSGRI
jgi:hypothetical protein